MNQFKYETVHGSITGYFNIYQAINGLIYLNMSDSVVNLTLEQIEKLNIDCYQLKDFGHNDFLKAYGLPF